MRDSRVKGPHPRVTFFLARHAKKRQNFADRRKLGHLRIEVLRGRNFQDVAAADRIGCFALPSVGRHAIRRSSSTRRASVREPIRPSWQTYLTALTIRPEGCPNGLGGRSA